MLFEPTITPYRLLAFTGWLTALAIVAGDMIFDNADAGHLGILIGCASAVLNVRSFIHQIEERQTRMFELGRESTRIHSVN